ncbi:MAG TPA: NUDIX pyrophosphatase [Kofleriaceae bacterium]|nr:NUDIX pyrophosphatase [Kofleriaceae bacterium]
MARVPIQVLVVPYRRGNTGLQVLLLRRADFDIWQFVAGGGETAESIEQTARREGFEEAGIPMSASYLKLDATATIPACWFSAWRNWPATTLLVPEHAFAVDATGYDPVISEEHVEWRWASMDEAIALLRFDSNRVALWELHERLYPGPRTKRPAFDVRHDGCPCSQPPRRG